MIQLHDVSFCYQSGQPILDDVELGLGPGLCLLLGPNGCGKSTLLRIAAGIERPDRGQVTIDGHEAWSAEVAARKHLAFLPEQAQITPYATVREVVALVAGLRRQPPEAAKAALAWAGLGGLGHRSVRELSMGQRRRALLATVRIGTPSCLLLDEPLEGMDRRIRSELLSWIAERLAAGATVVLASHQIEPFVAIADRALTIDQGRACLVPDLPSDPDQRLALLEEMARGQYGPASPAAISS